MTFKFQSKVKSEWIDYNGHMQDAYYGLVFSYAVDAFQDEIGFDRAYREQTGCTIYLVEEHKYFLREIKENDLVEVKIEVLEATEKLFHLHCTMCKHETAVAISELLEMHVKQKPTPHSVPIPGAILNRLRSLSLSHESKVKVSNRSRIISINRKS